VTEIGLVEVVDVEDDAPRAVHVGAEVLRVQVTLDPHARRPLVAPAVLGRRHVGVEQAGTTPVEGEGIGGHLAELRAERVCVRRHQVGERLDQDVDDQPAAVTQFRRTGHTGE
jgi:hypothetical protein